MKRGIVLSTNKIADQVSVAQRAEANGFDSVWATEFFHQHAYVRMAAIAASTSRVQVGSAISYAFMRSPMLCASGSMDIDEISEGRCILGLGSGTKSMNERWYSMPFEGAPAPRMVDAINLIRAYYAAAGGGGLKFNSEFFNVSIPQFTRPDAAREAIPIYLAGVNKGMIQAAANHADGLIGHPVYTRKYIQEEVLPRLKGTQCEFAPYILCSINEDREKARNEVRGQIGFYYTTQLYHSILDSHGWRAIGEQITAAFKAGDFKSMSTLVTDEMVDAIAIAGTPDEAREQLKQWHGLADHALFYSPSVGMSPARTTENLMAIADTFAV